MHRIFGRLADTIGPGIMALVVVAGCGTSESGGPVAEVSGKVLLDGKPLPAGQIIFQPTAPGMAAADVVSFRDGEYQSAAVPVGNVLARIISERATGRMIPGSSEPIPEVVDQVPPSYQQGIQLQVNPGAQVHDFELRTR